MRRRCELDECDESELREEDDESDGATSLNFGRKMTNQMNATSLNFGRKMTNQMNATSLNFGRKMTNRRRADDEVLLPHFPG